MIDDNLHLTLAAAAREFSFTVSTLRAEADRGHLSIYKIGKRYYTTRHDIHAMVEACRIPQKGRDFICNGAAAGPSEMDRASSAQAALRATLNGLGNCSANILPTNMSPRPARSR